MNPFDSKSYSEHKVFNQLTDYSVFYESFSGRVMGWMTPGTNAIINLDTYVYSSIKGTLESINDILKRGRINDSYALLRKYYDSTIINIYSNLYLSDNFSIDNFVVKQIDNWLKGKERLPEYRVMSKYIKDSPKLLSITNLLSQDKTYKDIRDRCNDHTHYNYFHNLLINDNEVYLENDRLKALDNFSKDLEDILIQHLAYIFYLNDHYMMSSDYVDSLEMGAQPDEGWQYLVAPFIQGIFDKVLKPRRMDIVAEIKVKTEMRLD
jgi:hypothetical protein